MYQVTSTARQLRFIQVRRYAIKYQRRDTKDRYSGCTALIKTKSENNVDLQRTTGNIATEDKTRASAYQSRSTEKKMAQKAHFQNVCFLFKSILYNIIII